MFDSFSYFKGLYPRVTQELILVDKAFVSDEICFCPYKKSRERELSFRKLLFNYVHGRMNVCELKLLALNR